VPRLDAARLSAWRELQSVIADIHRHIDDDLRREWAVPLGSFEALAALRDLGGRSRPQALARHMRIPPSSLTRRLDRLAEEGWIERYHDVDPNDHRAIDVELTPRGRTLWREMNRSYRRAVNARFAGRLSDEQIAVLGDVAAAVGQGSIVETVE
jgi:DNA-binding MarR family transcriptional regulator